MRLSKEAHTHTSISIFQCNVVGLFTNGKSAQASYAEDAFLELLNTVQPSLDRFFSETK